MANCSSGPHHIIMSCEESIDMISSSCEDFFCCERSSIGLTRHPPIQLCAEMQPSLRPILVEFTLGGSSFPCISFLFPPSSALLFCSIAVSLSFSGLNEEFGGRDGRLWKLVSPTEKMIKAKEETKTAIWEEDEAGDVSHIVCSVQRIHALIVRCQR